MHIICTNITLNM